MAQPRNKSLYNKVKVLANKKFGFLSSAHKSSWIVREYKKRGGKYIGFKPKYSGLKEWYKKNKRAKKSSHKSQMKKIKMRGGCDGGMCMMGGGYTEYDCPMCGEKFRQSRAILKHMAKIHAQRVPREIFKYNNHMPTPLPTRPSSPKISARKEKVKNNERCPFCPKKSTPNAIANHVATTHLSTETNNKVNDYDKLDKDFFDAIPKPNERDLEVNDYDEFVNPKFSQKGTGKVFSQYYGRKSSVMIPVPQNVRKWAKYAFKLRKLGFKGGLETGWKRAKQLSTKNSISIIDARYMFAWFKRHIYASYPSFKEWNSKGRPKTPFWHRKHGILSWVLWGANAGFNWINSKVVIGKLNKYFNKNYKKITLHKRH